MLFSTSDFRNPICLEMKLLRSGVGLDSMMEASGGGLPMVGHEIGSSRTGTGVMEIGSVDSSDTYASCNTQPFNSQADLTEEDSNLYVNPLLIEPTTPQPTEPARNVKKSASGDTALHSLGDEEETSFPGPERGSRGSLNETPLPKHRKTRFQQSAKLAESVGRESDESLETIKKRRPSFMPSRPLATATRLINQHLFGLQALGKSSKGRNGESRSSLSVDSIDSRIAATPETHRRSKSILKKHEGSSSCGLNHRPCRSGGHDDPETEKLISDNISGASGSDYSPGKSPPIGTTSAVTGGARSRTGTVLKFVLESSPTGAGLPPDLSPPPPLYICPPPPPMDQSPTEETKLLVRRHAHLNTS